MARLTGEHYDSALDHIQDGFQLISHEWKYLYVNDAVVKQSKYPDKSDLIGYTMMEKYPGIDQTEMFVSLKKCMIERVSAQLENEFKFPDGSSGWFELKIQPVPEGIVILSNDITDRKRAEIARMEHIRNLEQMLHMTSHKVRQPVAHILGISNLLGKKASSAEELAKMSDGMKDAALSLDNFTRELTAFIQTVKNSATSSGIRT